MTLLKERPDVRPPEKLPHEPPPVPRRRIRASVWWALLALIVLAGGIALTMWLTADDVGEAPTAAEISTGYLVKLPSGEYQVVPRAPSVDAMNPSTGYPVKLPSGEYMVVPRATTGAAMIPATTFVELPSGELFEVPAMRTIELPSGEFVEVPLSDAVVGGLIDPSTQRP